MEHHLSANPCQVPSGISTPQGFVAVAFATAMLLSAILHWQTGRWNVVLEPDSLSYLNFDWTSLEGVFRGIRTPGYPLFLAVVEACFGRSAIAVLHWLALAVGVIVWYRGLRHMSFRPWMAAFASIPLLFSRGTWDLGAAVASDSLGISLAIASTGLFLTALANPRSVASWGLLGTATLAAILVRPAYLFLVPLWPVLAFWLAGLILRRQVREVIAVVMLATLATGLPLVTYCAVRAAAIGEFGLVSFAGYNLIGVTGQYLSEDDLPKLSDSSRALAARMIERRDRVDGYRPPMDYPTMVFLFNPTVWTTAAPAAESLYGSDTAKCNLHLKTLAMESLALHRTEYASWLLHNGRSMIDQLLRGALTDVGSKLAFLAFAFAAGSMLMYSCRNSDYEHAKLDPSVESASAEFRYMEMQLLFWTVVAFASAKGLLVIMVEPALGRYVSAVGCLIPSAVGWAFSSLIDTARPYLKQRLEK